MWQKREQRRRHRVEAGTSAVTAAEEQLRGHTMRRTRWKEQRRINGKVQFVTVALMAAIFLVCLASAPLLIDAQLAWSPIQVDSESKWMINIFPAGLPLIGDREERGRFPPHCVPGLMGSAAIFQMRIIYIGKQPTE